MAPEQKKELTPEEQNRKDRVRLRLFILLICLDILLAGYLVFEMIVIIKESSKQNQNTAIDMLVQITRLIKLLR